MSVIGSKKISPEANLLFHSSPAWSKMLKKVDYASTSTPIHQLSQLRDMERVPRTIALIKDIKRTDVDMGIILKDPTGEVKGTLHEKVVQKYESILTPGAVLDLQDVTFFHVDFYF